jgi:uncharacterized protein (DUF427 family)
MAKAIWNGMVIAESNQVTRLGGKVYFPHPSVKSNYFQESETHRVCPVNGTANYYHIEVNGKKKPNAAHYYPNPNPKVKSIQNLVGFDDDIEIRE